MDLSPVQVQSVILLAQGHKSYQVAKLMNVTPETISVWKRHPAFSAMIERYKLELLESARDSLRANLHDAVATISDLMHNAKNERTRLKAAETVLRLAGIDSPHNFTWGINCTHIDTDR